MTLTLTTGAFRALPGDQHAAVTDWLATFAVDHLGYPDCVTHVAVEPDGHVLIRVKEWDRSKGGGIRLDVDGRPFTVTRADGSWSDGIERPELGFVPDGACLESTFESVLDGPLPTLVAQAFGLVDFEVGFTASQLDDDLAAMLDA